ncbi:cytochrome b/b6 domain-containing protein [Roseospira navarrensis]|uniref:Cytochrome B6 n=1 Tax=Roseospira navarrensis TaxID=140058 RepID=A0A7X1ZDW5_9PROT|nr:cytochrome b/b6 domain-containing protein [Roseospira navarrensis]MQX35761.1 cytochrome B6 [Roseospira navarrensis]
MASSSETGAAPAASSAPRVAVKIWDLPTRLFHWSLAVALGVCWWSGEEGNFTVHFISGHVVFGLVLFRLAWGVIGSQTARFSDFVKGPGEIGRYLRGLFSTTRKDNALGHNPAGGLMVILLLLATGGQALTGLFASENTWAFVSGPLASLVGSDLSSTITSLHKGILFDTLLVLAAVHIVAAFGYLFIKKENLIRPMVIGHKRLPAEAAARAPRLANPLLALLVAAVAAGVAYGLHSLT